ncbi:hypothetical protein MHYP_G00202050 [Metynnis hypsauchen]
MSKSGSKSGLQKIRSSASSSSRQTHSSSATIAAALARAEAQAAKAEAEYAERENELKVQQAQLEASMTVEKARLEVSLDTLRLEKKAAAALAKAEALEVAAEQENEDVISKAELLSDDRKERTKEYIQGHTIHESSISMPVLEGPFFDGVHLAGSVHQYKPTITIQHQTDEQGNEYEEVSSLQRDSKPLTRTLGPDVKKTFPSMCQEINENISIQMRNKEVHSSKLPQTSQTMQSPFGVYNNGSTHRQQWRYVRTKHNPADIATRPIPTVHLKNTIWFTGPKFLSEAGEPSAKEMFELMEPAQDSEIWPQVTALSTVVSVHLGSHCFERFSSWNSLTRAVSVLIHIIQCFKKTQNDNTEQCKGWHHCSSALAVDALTQSTAVIIRTVQQEVYTEELECLRSNIRLPKNSSLCTLDPFIDQDGLLRVRGH